MFGKVILIAVVGLITWAVVARDSQGAGSGLRYRVRPGDTLWSIAASHYGGDPREAIYRIVRRNHLDASLLVPGQQVVLP
jgi:LysM repeat protein